MPGPLRLITIGFSHYCEKARWALDRSALAYREEEHAPLFHWRASFGAGGGRTVPVLVTPERVLRDSNEIVRFVDEQLPRARRLLPEDAAQRAEVTAWVEALDRGLGPAVRRYLYFYVLRDREAAVELLASTGPAWERRAVRATFPMMRAVMMRGLKITPAGAKRSHERIMRTLTTVEAGLAEGRQFLVGERFTAADLTLASLASLLLRPLPPLPPLPPSHAGFQAPARCEAIPEVAALMARARGSRAGQHALRCYAQERPPRRGLTPG